MRGEILGAERRRFWHDDEKLEIVASVGIAGASVTQVAQRHEIKRQQIYAWRHELKKKGLWSPDAGALFLPLDMPVTAGVPVAQAPVAELPPPVAVELRLRGGRSLHFESTAHVHHLRHGAATSACPWTLGRNTKAVAPANTLSAPTPK
ncbi:IS66-like element accessory protein TnpA [Roseovarius sp. S1116L3]|uniref:IS66-like element accessory protein TnpA n=1 Tax=Roseovarius roseus TaxID=3342636 RepID=UPI00372A2565